MEHDVALCGLHFAIGPNDFEDRYKQKCGQQFGMNAFCDELVQDCLVGNAREF